MHRSDWCSVNACFHSTICWNQNQALIEPVIICHTPDMLWAGTGPREYWGSICLARTQLQLMCCATRCLLSSNFRQGAGKGSEVQMRSLRDNQCRFQTEEHTWGSERISIEENHVRVVGIGHTVAQKTIPMFDQFQLYASYHHG